MTRLLSLKTQFKLYPYFPKPIRNLLESAQGFQGSPLGTTDLRFNYFIVDGGWGSWTAWSTCNVTCDSGTQMRTRICDNPTPVGAGLDCNGSDSESMDCNEPSCPSECETPPSGASSNMTDWWDNNPKFQGENVT